MNKFINTTSQFVANSGAFAKVVGILEQVDRRSTNYLRVLTYHRIGDPSVHPGLYPRITVTPEAFTEQMNYLATHYQVLSMPELLELYHTGVTLPPRAALVTFDDAYCDFAEYAWPIMQRYHLPVTLFVPTGFPDQPERIFWWDWLYQAVTTTTRRTDLKLLSGIVALATPTDRELAFSHIRDHLKSLPHEEAMRTVEAICAELEVARPPHAVLGWQALRQLAAEGVTLGAHTRNHPLMNRIDPKQMQAEALGSLHDLEQEIGSALPIFAYPSGGMNEQAVQVLAEAGFVLAFGTQRGINMLYKTHPLCLRRINVGPRTTLPILRAQLLSWSNYLN